MLPFAPLEHVRACLPGPSTRARANRTLWAQYDEANQRSRFSDRLFYDNHGWAASRNCEYEGDFNKNLQHNGRDPVTRGNVSFYVMRTDIFYIN